MWWHPFLELSWESLTWLLMFLTVASLIGWMWLATMGRQLRTDVAPLGIVSLQLCDSSQASQEIVDSWDKTAQENAVRSLTLDYYFVPIYTTALAVVGIMAARWFSQQGMLFMGNLAVALAWGQWLAGMIDYAENSTLLRMLQMYPEIPESLCRFGSTCTRLKFLLILMGIASCLFGFLVSMTGSGTLAG